MTGGTGARPARAPLAPGDLLDANVWLALSVSDHQHHARARLYWDGEAAEALAFCRITALALPRHLTTAAIMGPRALSGAAAWDALTRWLALPNIRLASEPAALDELLQHWARSLDLRAGAWTDAYLAAFATASGLRLVSFDRGFTRFPGLSFLHLAA